MLLVWGWGIIRPSSSSGIPLLLLLLLLLLLDLWPSSLVSCPSALTFWILRVVVHLGPPVVISPTPGTLALNGVE